MRFFTFLIYIYALTVNAQKTEKIFFISANPFAMSDIITDLENQESQEVFGKLVIPIDSLNNKKVKILVSIA